MIEDSRPDRFIVDGRGYSQVIRDMAASIPLEEGRNLMLNHLVTEVHYDQPGDLPVRVVSQDQRTGRRTIFRAKWVVTTFSAGVLQSDLLTFSPPLPRWKSEVLHMLRQSEALHYTPVLRDSDLYASSFMP